MQRKTAKNSERIKCTKCFKSLGIDARIEMYAFLAEHGETTVGDLVDLVGLTQPTVSYHLKDMKKLGLLSSRKSGKEVYYSVDHSCPGYGSTCALSLAKFSRVPHVASN